MASAYPIKHSPYGSHSILLNLFPASGSGQAVLDIGCGEGHLSLLLAKRGFRVLGVEQPGCFGQEFPSSVELVQADLEQGLPPLPISFDYILCADVLEHLRHPEHLLAGMRAALKPTGVLIASLPNSGNIYFRLNILAGRFPQHDRGLFDRTHLRFFMWTNWLDLFSAAGFEFRRISVTSLPISLTVPSNLENSVPVRLAEGVCYGLAKVWKRLFAYQFIVVASPRR